MENLRNSHKYSELLCLLDTTTSLRKYLLIVLLERQKGVCNVCKREAKLWEIDHLIYHPRITINELQLLCYKCHIKITTSRRIEKSLYSKKERLEKYQSWDIRNKKHVSKTYRR